MPLVGLGGYVLSKHSHHKPVQTTVTGEFFKIKISTSYDKINGRIFLSFDTYPISYDGIKVRLNVQLKSQTTERGNAVYNDIDLFEHCPIETILPCKS